MRPYIDRHPEQRHNEVYAGNTTAKEKRTRGPFRLGEAALQCDGTPIPDAEYHNIRPLFIVVPDEEET